MIRLNGLGCRCSGARPGDGSGSGYGWEGGGGLNGRSGIHPYTGRDDGTGYGITNGGQGDDGATLEHVACSIVEVLL